MKIDHFKKTGYGKTAIDLCKFSKANFEIFNSSRIFGELVKMIAVIKFWIVTILIQITTRLDSTSKNSKSGLISTVLSFSDVFYFRWAIFFIFWV